MIICSACIITEKTSKVRIFFEALAQVERGRDWTLIIIGLELAF